MVAVALAAGAGTAAREQAATPAFDVTEQSIEDLQKALSDGRVTSVQLVEAYLARIAAYDQQGPALNSIAAVNPQAKEAAAALDAERAAKGPRGPLHGIPMLVKDNYETVEMPTTAGSIALAGFNPGRDAFLVQRLKAAGAIVLGKTTMHELAAGILTVGSGFGQTKNPYDLDRTPGGSSGGTGAAVAANFAAVGMGSDTCGSIRIPAANNNLVGLRGTQGLSSRRGIVPLSSTQDIGGPIARSITDLAIVLDATVAPDQHDAQTLQARAARPDDDDDDERPRSYRSAAAAGALKGARLGVLRSLFGDTPDDQEVTTIVDEAIVSLRKAGAEVVEVEIPGLDTLLQSTMIAADFKFDLMEYLASAPQPPVRSLSEILERGLYHAALEATFRARDATLMRETDATRRARIRQAALRAVTAAVLDEQRLDAIVYPTLRRKPARIGDAQPGTNCQLSAHSGLPALSLPAGFTADEVPIGMELLGPAWSERALLALGYDIERTLNLRRPPFSTPPLVQGKRPAARSVAATAGAVTLNATYDPTTSRLQYTLTSSAKPAPPLGTIWLHLGTPAAPGPARHRLDDPARPATLPVSGSVTLAAADRQSLQTDGLLLRVYPAGDRELVAIYLPEMRAWK